MSSEWGKHADNYDETVYSITRYPKKNKRIIDRLRPGTRAAIVGCGSATHLQEQILREVDMAQVITSDSSLEMIRASRSKFSHSKLVHITADTKQLPLEDGSLDFVISTNSILPETRERVQRLFESIARVGRVLLAYVPSFTCNAEYSAAHPKEDWLELDHAEMRVWDTGAWQCYHTRESLLQELGDAGFEKVTIEEVGAESDEELQQLTNLYGERFAQHLWEYFVVAEKGSQRG